MRSAGTTAARVTDRLAPASIVPRLHLADPGPGSHRNPSNHLRHAQDDHAELASRVAFGRLQLVWSLTSTLSSWRDQADDPGHPASPRLERTVCARAGTPIRRGRRSLVSQRAPWPRLIKTLQHEALRHQALLLSRRHGRQGTLLSPHRRAQSSDRSHMLPRLPAALFRAYLDTPKEIDRSRKDRQPQSRDR